jgi:hypothetical protein
MYTEEVAMANGELCGLVKNKVNECWAGECGDEINWILKKFCNASSSVHLGSQYLPSG